MALHPRLDEERPRPQRLAQRRPLRAPESASGGLRHSAHLRARRSGPQSLTASGENHPRYDRMRRRALLPQNSCGGSTPYQIRTGRGFACSSTSPEATAKQESCAVEAFSKGGLALALDAASIVPGGADVADVARAGAGTASIVVSVATKDRPGQALGVTGAVLTGAGAFTEWQGATAAKNIAEAIPIVGGVVGIGAVLYDGKGILKDYNDCVDH